MANSNGTNGYIKANDTEAKTPLKILIMGAGIGGLTAAAALRKEGHDIQVRKIVSDLFDSY